jgi:hypothetical protein
MRLVENRNGLIAAALVTHADGYAERAALLMLAENQQKRASRITVAADKAYDTEDSTHGAGVECDSAYHLKRQEPP